MRSIILVGAFALAKACVPEQVFVSYGTTPDAMMISWATSVSGNSVVTYGLSPSSLTSTVAAQEVQYNWT